MACRTLVTGGAGFIGSHLVDSLLQRGEQVSVIDNFNNFYDPEIKRSNIREHLQHDNYALVEGDIRDNQKIIDTFKAGKFDRVIHLAAMAGVRRSIEQPALYNEVNLIGTLNLLEACREYSVNDFIFASSSSVYGNNEKLPFSESDPVDNPISPYAATKKSGELMAYTFHSLYGMKMACLRFFTVYGPRQRPEMAIHLFADAIYHGREINMFGDGESSRDYTFIGDIITGILGCTTSEYDYQIINLGRSDTIKLRELISKLEQRIGRQAMIVQKENQPGDVNHTYADISKAKRMIGYDPVVSIDEGLDHFCEWYLERLDSK